VLFNKGHEQKQLSPAFLWHFKLGDPPSSPNAAALPSAFDPRKMVRKVPLAARRQALETTLPLYTEENPKFYDLDT